MAEIIFIVSQTIKHRVKVFVWFSYFVILLTWLILLCTIALHCNHPIRRGEGSSTKSFNNHLFEVEDQSEMRFDCRSLWLMGSLPNPCYVPHIMLKLKSSENIFEIHISSLNCNQFGLNFSNYSNEKWKINHYYFVNLLHIHLLIHLTPSPSLLNPHCTVNPTL